MMDEVKVVLRGTVESGLWKCDSRRRCGVRSRRISGIAGFPWCGFVLWEEYDLELLGYGWFLTGVVAGGVMVGIGYCVYASRRVGVILGIPRVKLCLRLFRGR